MTPRYSRPPLYVEVVDQIKGKIQRGDWEYGQKIPPEDELAEFLCVSRATLREGISYLVNKGVLRRQRGIGTFVGKKEEITAGLETLMSVTQWIEKHGYQPGTQGLELLRRPLSSGEREIFKFWNLSTIGEIHRVRTADQTPVMYCVDIIPDQFMPERPEELTESLFQYLEEKTEQIVIHARSTIEVTLATSEIAGKLSVARGVPLLRLIQVHYNQDMIPLLLSHDHFVPERFRFGIIRHRS